MSEQVGSLIKEARLAAGMTQKELAEAVDGLSAKSISEAERGLRELTDEQLAAIAEATGSESLLHDAEEDESPAAPSKVEAAGSVGDILKLFNAAVDPAVKEAAVSVLKAAATPEAATPEDEVTTEAEATPEAEAASEAAATPEDEDEPVAEAAPKAEDVPEGEIAPEAKATPEDAAAPEAEAEPTGGVEDILKLINAAEPAVREAAAAVLKTEKSQGKDTLNDVLPTVAGMLGGNKGGDPLIAIIGFLASKEGRAFVGNLKGIVGNVTDMLNQDGAIGDIDHEARKALSSLLVFTFLYSVAIYILLLSFYFWLIRTDIKPQE